ncbi:MAG: peptidoglycan DD-metalloendopeptidase family protein [Chloroflexota bacterium]
MLPRHRRVRLRRAMHEATGPFRGRHDHPNRPDRVHRHDQAHRRRASVLPRAALLLTFVAAVGVALVFQPYQGTRATPVWTWAPLPATAFDTIGPISSGIGVDRARRSVPQSAWSKMPPDERPSAANGTDPATSAVPIQETAPAGPIHTVARGDTLWTISRRHSADLASILRWNEAIDPQRLVAGQQILVPGGSKMKPLPVPAPTTTRPGSASSNQIKQLPAIVAQAGDHVWPLPIRGTLTRRFSAAHPGIDIAAPKGTPVRAVADGTVVWAGWKNNGGGYVVVIEHPDGMRSTYNHNSKVTVGKGDQVAQGATIALVGSTGWSTGPHLDLRIEMGGRFIDPLRVY